MTNQDVEPTQYRLLIRLTSPDGETLMEGVLLEAGQPDIFGNVYTAEALQGIVESLGKEPGPVGERHTRPDLKLGS